MIRNVCFLDPDQNLSDDSGSDSETVGQVKRNDIEWQNFSKKMDTESSVSMS
jgi:hypothetical protein